ncbi:unnamed protein product [Phyllotreta striolata]|uniref:SNF-related serine/threonine-protein kinase n=1 Tax=Phyllotreta striolata TaxID=444603 RepID=A0A9N9XU65_PHYSR|nr:unnamed protein product [Phyllotreta striolata]
MNRKLRLSSKGNSQDVGSKQYDGKIAGLYDLEETLGRGHFAVVKLARHVFTGEKVAVKVIDKSKLDEVSKAHLFQEVRCMKLVQHPNVVRLYEVIDTATKLYLVLELGDGGDLYEYIMRHDTGLPEKAAKEYFSQIVRAISYCHQLHVVHRDLKPENVVFFKKQGIVKLTDFGFSNKFYPGQKLETSCGSLAYSAPEILLGDSYDAPAVDVWSLGVILYMLVCGHPPFQEANDSETLTMIMDCKYDIPSHVSQNCQKLISRMLLRNPEKRATLAEISNHPWLCSTTKTLHADSIPLVSREQLQEDDHNFIVQKIVNGNVATKEEIQESLDKNEYNHITATYYLLAERKLRYKRQEQAAKSKRPEELPVFQNTQNANQDDSVSVKPNLLNVPRTPGDIPQRSRKCSIVQEDEEEEDMSSCGVREELASTLNRRGSRSEGRLNLTLQERLLESEKRKPPELKYPSGVKKATAKVNQKLEQHKVKSDTKLQQQQPVVPVITTTEHKSVEPVVEASAVDSGDANARQFAGYNPSYDRRRAKFHKSRTASCSSSDASDDDSEKRKKRAQKLNTPSKSFETRRDSYDDSSDSQEPGTGAGTSGFGSLKSGGIGIGNNTTKTDSKESKENEKREPCNDKNGKNHTNVSSFERNHRLCRKKSGKTRLRESQSLNRITEVQEDAQALVVSTTLSSMPGSLAPKVKSVGAKILNGLGKSSKKPKERDEDSSRLSRRDQSKGSEECSKLEKCGVRKIRVFGRYFHVQRKLCIPLAGLFRRNGLYKAQSCGSLTKDRIMGGARGRPVSCIKGDGDVNQNEPNKPLVCSELRDICTVHVHIGQATKCSFC